MSRRGVALAAIALTLAMSTGAAASATVAAARRDAGSAALALRTAGVRGALDTTFQRYADTMHDLVALAGAGLPTSAGTAPLDAAIAGIVDDRLPGAHQVLVIGPDQAVLATRAVDGSTPAPTAALTGEPELARALDLARSSGRLVATPAHVLPTDRDLPPAHRQPAFELAAAVPGPVFQGWVVISVRAADLLGTSLRTAGITGVDAVLTETSPDGVTHEVVRWAEGGTADRDGPAADSVDVALAGHTWQILVRSTTPLGTGGVPTTLILLGAALAGVLLAGTILALDSARLRALRRSGRAAGELRAGLDRAVRAEQALREHAAELSGFATVAAENLHAPLHTIAGFTELLLDEVAPQLDPTSRGFLDRIRNSTRRMLVMVDELLAYAAAGEAALKLEPVDTERLALDAAAARLDGHDGERPSIDIGELPVVTADTALLRQVLDQLIGNAVGFVRHGTAARVTVGARQQADGWWRIEVADRGIGVPADHRERVFAPFHRTPAAEGYPGTGLGLAVCRRIIALHGGEIGVEANPGGGSVFWFTVCATGVTLSPDDLGALTAA
jgi:signal transduction histidine kinase